MSWNYLKNNRSLIAGALVLPAAAAASLLLGNGAVSSGDLLRALTGKGAAEAAGIILYEIRLPRTAAGILCGSGLSVAGLLLQETLRNPLASPGIMGINAGAGLFVLLAGILFPGFYFARSLAAFAGALTAVVLVFGISSRAGVSKSRIILSGVAVSTLMNAGINAVITFRPESAVDKAGFSMGSLSGVDASRLPVPALLIIGGLAGSLLLAGGIELFAIGDEAAAGVGLSVTRYRVLTVACASLLAAASISLCGLLGFLGLIVPNILRLEEGGIRTRILGCALWGSSLLLVCDTLMRTCFYPYEMPAGLLLSLLGTPFFILLLVRRGRGRRYE